MSIDRKSDKNQWPEHKKFPYNFDKHFVQTVIERDLQAATNPLIITGYASLDRIIDFLADSYYKLYQNSNALAEIRLLLGHEPYPTNTQEFPDSYKFDPEIEEYWLKRGISILKCGKVIKAIELLKTQQVQVRISDKKPIHAKIYRGDNAITIGSSNFSNSGFVSQIEANVRFENIKKESKRFNEAELLSERIWELGKDYKDELIELLKKLLSKVGWQEALARACAELLEGEWAKQYQMTSYFGDENSFWPSQIQGIAQAIWVIENVGSVLIADATGSGKTRMGANLIKSVINQIWATGRKRKGSPVLICPPAVQDGWDEEFGNCDFNLKTYSSGALVKRANKNEELIEAIRRSQVLALDEAHNFLNRTSQRTQAVFKNMADYVILFTATPINRGSQDLLAIIELLGADNFDDELLEILKRLWKGGKLEQKMQEGERQLLRREIQKFTLRRTKSMLNQMIDENPELYQNKLGNPCRYPQHESKTYICGETESDRSLAKQIRELTQQLRGLVMLQTNFKVSKYQRQLGISDEDYLDMRLKSAPRLCSYNVMSCLRSSKAALLEHISGTEFVQECLILGNLSKNKTGNIIQRLDSIAGKPPQNKLEIELPDWLSDRYAHRLECEKEIAIYKKIAELTKKISYSREERKAKHLLELLENHKLLIAFDSHIISLSDIKQRIERLEKDSQKVIIATGDDKTYRKQVNDLFKLGSTASGVIALCSDAMSEGVNLQQASAVVLLDMPTVIRLAEQRIGRVERLDSPHKIIQVWWPQDSDEFALRSSETKLAKRHRLVSDLLGSNFPLPDLAEEEIDRDDLSLPADLAEDDEIVTPESEIRQLEELAKIRKSYELGDVFDPVRSLVENSQIENNKFLVPRKVYKQVRNTKLSGTWVSCVTAEHPWAFFAVAGTEWGAPRWVYLDHLEAEKVITDMERISEKLRKNLPASVRDIPIEDATQDLEEFLKKLQESEILLLPKKKQRALEEMEKVLEEYRQKAAQEGKEAVVTEINVLTDWMKAVDLSKLAEWWLDLIRPWWFERLKQPRRYTPIRLQDIRTDLIKKAIPMEQLREAFNLPKVKPLDERIVAAIIGIY